MYTHEHTLRTKNITMNMQLPNSIDRSVWQREWGVDFFLKKTQQRTIQLRQFVDSKSKAFAIIREGDSIEIHENCQS